MLDRIEAARSLVPRGVLGLFPAASVGDDIQVYTDRSATESGRCAFPAAVRQGSSENLTLADFIAPASSGHADWVGAFAVTVAGAEELAASLEARHDDYGAILVKAISDRLAEASAGRAHEIVRKTLWGYAPAESLDYEALIRESYRRHPPRAGLPCLPRSRREAHALRPARRSAGSAFASTELRHAAGLVGERMVLRASAGEVLRHRSRRPRSGRGLRAAEGLDGDRGRALAAPNLGYDPEGAP